MVACSQISRNGLQTLGMVLFWISPSAQFMTVLESQSCSKKKLAFCTHCTSSRQLGKPEPLLLVILEYLQDMSTENSQLIDANDHENKDSFERVAVLLQPTPC